VTELDNKLEDLQPEETPDTSAAAETPKSSEAPEGSLASPGDPAMDASFMSESIYEKLPTPSPKSLRHRSIRMKLMEFASSGQWLTMNSRETFHADSARAFRPGIIDQGN
jgi:hypothetical protein